MRIKIEGATPSNIAQTLQDIIDKFNVDIGTANIYINFTQQGNPMIFVDDNYDELYISRTLIPNEKTPKMNFSIGKFVPKAEIKAYKEQEEQKRIAEFERMTYLDNIGYIYICLKDNKYKIYLSTQKPTSSEFKYKLKQKEKEGYAIVLITKHAYARNFLHKLNKKFKQEGKAITNTSYPFFNLNSKDLNYIKSQADEIITEKNQINTN